MKVDLQTQNSFRGIRLDNNKFEYTRAVRNLLQRQGINVAGHRTFYVNNDFYSKRKIIDYIRDRYHFDVNECGVVFFPWSGEAWIIGRPSSEQKIVKKLNNNGVNARLNLLM